MQVDISYRDGPPESDDIQSHCPSSSQSRSESRQDVTEIKTTANKLKADDWNIHDGSGPSHIGPSDSSQVRKKRKIVHSAQRDIYLGSFLVSNAWSTVRGTGYVKSGDVICVERDTLDKDSKEAKKGKSKQVTLTSMMKGSAKTSSMKKPKTANTIVRLTNERGFGMFVR